MQTQNSLIQAPEKKVRIPVWLYPSTLESIDRAMEMANCKNRSEFLENAAQFYAGYVSSQEATQYLPPILVDAFRGVVQNSEARTARLLFKLAVEVSMMAKVLALGLEIDPKELDRIRGQCVQQVKSTNGSISFKEAVKEWAE